jgi:hypothetical protein
MARYRYAATTPCWDAPRNRVLEWLILGLFALVLICQFMTMVPGIGYSCWLIGLVLSLEVLVLVVLLLRARS